MTKVLFIVFFFITVIGCSKEEDVLQLSTEPIFNLDSDEHLLKIKITSSSAWKVTGDETWCEVVKANGITGDSLIIRVGVNLLKESRSHTLQIVNLEEKTEIKINQEGATGEYHYRLPVIFHVLCYENISVDPALAARLIEVLNDVNALYAGKNGNPVNMNLEFVPVTRDPGGNLLQHVGVNWVRHSHEKINYEEFTANKYGDASWMWNPDTYINIVIATFLTEGIAGYSELPFTPRNNPLEGLLSDDRYYFMLPIDYFPCLIINKEYVNKTNPTPQGDQDMGIVTLSHELGHYLGLFHAFSKDDYEVNSDYCEDTPDYSRSSYSFWVSMHSSATWPEKAQRISVDGDVFTSTNVMDYKEGYMNQFTPDQRKRVRHVLNYSPLIPGPKIPVEPVLVTSQNREAIVCVESVDNIIKVK